MNYDEIYQMIYFGTEGQFGPRSIEVNREVVYTTSKMRVYECFKKNFDTSFVRVFRMSDGVEIKSMSATFVDNG